MSRETNQRYPFLDAFGIWPSHRKIEEDGSVWSQDPPRGVNLRVQPASVSEVFLPMDRPWEGPGTAGIIALLHDEGRYRLWYSTTPADQDHRLVCYAESDDGVEWRRPALGRVAWNGSTKNNIVSVDGEHHLGFVFRDTTAPADQRYKAIAPKGRYFRNGRHDPDLDSKQAKKLLADLDLGGVSREDRRRALSIHHALHASVSPDGLTWRNLTEPILDVGETALDTHNLCVYDDQTQRYVAYLRGHQDRRRLVRRSEGASFTDLGGAQPCLLCDPQDPIDDDIYTSCYCPYPDLPGRHLMFPSIYHRIESTIDIQLAVSRDGCQWQRPERRAIVDRRIDEETFGCLYASPNLIVVGDQWRLPLQASRSPHDFRRRRATYPPDNELRWASWKPDRLVGLEAEDEGSVVLVERQLSGAPMRLNYRTAHDGWIRVELVEPPHTPPQPVEALPCFGIQVAEAISGDELQRVVHWGGRSDLSALKGREVALRLHLRRAQVFCIEL